MVTYFTKEFMERTNHHYTGIPTATTLLYLYVLWALLEEGLWVNLLVGRGGGALWFGLHFRLFEWWQSVSDKFEFVFLLKSPTAVMIMTNNPHH